MNLKQPVVIVGLGKTGFACLEFLRSQQIDCKVVDTRKNPPFLEQAIREYSDVEIELGEFKETSFNSAGTLIVSPGVSLSEQITHQTIDNGTEIIGDIELFARTQPRNVVAITGSNGKSTVTDLTTKMLNALGFKTAMAGNIGTPVLSLLNKENYDYWVLELSSFQLDSTFTLSPQVAIVLNLSPDHMDRYTDFEAYKKSKLSIYTLAQKGVYPVANQWGLKTSGQALTFGLSSNATFNLSDSKDNSQILVEGKPWMAQSNIRLQGLHNGLNILASLAILKALGISLWGENQSKLNQLLKTYSGLPHRCELVETKDGVVWINDSKSTNTGSTEAAISGFSAQYSGKMILIAGGDAKGADLSVLVPEIHQHISTLITLGIDGPELARLVTQIEVIQVDSIEKAVIEAANRVPAEGMVLLSPACASLDMFKNYQDRGEKFCKAVKEVAA